MPTSAEEIRTAVEQRFAKIARSPEQEQKFPVGPASATKLGYDHQEIDALPHSVTESFCGVGNPLGLGEVRPGQTVLDGSCCSRRLHPSLAGSSHPSA
jgi:arsenite methyltransferase